MGGAIVTSKRAVMVLVAFLFGTVVLASTPVSAPNPRGTDPVNWNCAELGSQSAASGLSPEEMMCNLVQLLNKIKLFEFVDDFSFVALLVLFALRSLTIALGPNANLKFPPFLWSSFAAALLFMGMSSVRDFVGGVFQEFYRVSSAITEMMLVESMNQIVSILSGVKDVGEGVTTEMLLQQMNAQIEAECVQPFVDSRAAITVYLPGLPDPTFRVDNPSREQVVQHCRMAYGMADPTEAYQAFGREVPTEWPTGQEWSAHQGQNRRGLGLQGVGLQSYGPASGGSTQRSAQRAAAAPAAPAAVAILRNASDSAKGVARVLFRIVDFVLFPIFSLMNMVKFGSGLVYVISSLVLPIGVVLIVAGQGSAFFSNWFKVVLGALLAVLIMPTMWSVIVSLSVASPLLVFVQYFQDFGAMLTGPGSLLDKVLGSGLKLLEAVGLLPMVVLNFVLGLVTSIGLVAYLQKVIISFLAGAAASAGGLSPMVGGFFKRGSIGPKVATADGLKKVQTQVEEIRTALGLPASTPSGTSRTTRTPPAGSGTSGSSGGSGTPGGGRAGKTSSSGGKTP